MRIAIVGISIEILLSSPAVTDFDSLQQYEGGEIRAADLWMIRGMLQRLDAEADIEAVPLYWATALPGGPLTGEAYGAVKAKTISLLAEKGSFDGILVANHGALGVAGMNADADTDFVESIRAEVGPQVAIGVALDLHGDMTPGLLAAATIFSVLRTAPHRDDRETGYRAADQLIRVLRQGLRPRKAAVRIPMLTPGENAVTVSAPAKALYGSLPEYDSRQGIIEANILVGFAWNDVPWAGMTALVTSDGDAGAARDAALDLAARIWSERAEFRLRMETAEVRDGLLRAAQSRRHPVFLSDAGDNTTAGAPGDLTMVLVAAIDAADLDDVVVAGITAPGIVRQCLAAGAGATIEIEIGAEHVSRPPAVHRVAAFVEDCGAFLQLSGFQPYRSRESAWARVRIGNVIATFHARPIGITTPDHFRSMGIHPTEHQAYVVKLGYLHPQLEDLVGRHILLLTDGCSQVDMTRLPWHRVPRPIYPIDADFGWQPSDGLYGDR
jgi:microcystin degradation protein MlrC